MGRDYISPGFMPIRGLYQRQDDLEDRAAAVRAIHGGRCPAVPGDRHFKQRSQVKAHPLRLLDALFDARCGPQGAQNGLQAQNSLAGSRHIAALIGADTSDSGLSSDERTIASGVRNSCESLPPNVLRYWVCSLSRTSRRSKLVRPPGLRAHPLVSVRTVTRHRVVIKAST